ncbi:MAG: rod shape-determining protein MreC [Lentisphaeria bacterium]|nr:rod shape-determining protein MreC [Lentisphaeria bacterium]
MRRNYSYKKNSKNSWLFIGLAVLIIFIVASIKSLDFYFRRVVNDFFYPYANSVAVAGNITVENSIYYTMSKPELIAEIEKLKSQNKLLTEQQVLFNDLEKQNKELRIQKNLPAKGQFSFINGEVIIRDPINWFDVFTVNRGGRDGVKKGSAVFTFDNNSKPLLIGVVSEVYSHSAEVVTLSSPEFKISGKLALSDNIGLINYNVNRYRTNNQYVSIDLLPNNGHYVMGEELFTTGFEENIPAGIKIGNLESLDRDNSPYSNQLYVSGMISIKNNFANSRFVSIAIKKSL